MRLKFFQLLNYTPLNSLNETANLECKPYEMVFRLINFGFPLILDGDNDKIVALQDVQNLVTLIPNTDQFIRP